jgi:hypothetical protein
MFYVDPHLARVTVRGGFVADLNSGGTNNATVAAPEIRLTSQADGNYTPSVGIVSGLTAPTRDDQAANKWYVDHVVQPFNTIFVDPNAAAGDTITTQNGLNYTQSGLQNGTWLIDVLCYGKPNIRYTGGAIGSQFLAYNLTGDPIQDKYKFDITDDDNYTVANQKMVVTKHVVTVTDGQVTITFKTPSQAGSSDTTNGFIILKYFQLTGIRIGN